MTLTFKEVSEIMKIIDASECEEIVLELKGMKLVVRRGAGVTHAAAPLLNPAEQNANQPQNGARPAATPAATVNAPAPASATPGAVADGVQVRAPMVGSFYRRPAPDEPPFVEVGTRVKEGDPLCLIEVMKLYTTIAAPASGTVRQIAAEDAQLIEFDQVLFVIEPD